MRFTALPARIAVASCLSVAVCLGAAPAALAQPNPIVPVVPWDSLARWDSGALNINAVNARDIGGYVTADGQVVKSGKVFRAAALDTLTDADIALLAAKGLTDIDDLRTADERAKQPDRDVPGASNNWYNVLGTLPATEALDINGIYRQFVVSEGAREGFSAVLRDIIESDGAVLYHCTAGKDRTGWTTAVLLTILGVPHETVVQDYLLSNNYRGVDPNANSEAAMLTGGVHASWLESAFAAAESEYGSFDAYVREGLGITDQDVAALKGKLLQSFDLADQVERAIG